MSKRQENNAKIASDFFHLMSEKRPTLKITGVYKTRTGFLDVVCNVCQYSWPTTPSVLLRGKGCPCCSAYLYTKETYQKLLDSNNRNVDLVSDYKGSQEPIKARCRCCDYEWEASTANLLQYSGCLMCSGKAKGSAEKLQKCFDEFQHDVKVVGNYVNNSTPIECLCLVCNQLFYPVGASIIYGSGCSNCKKGGFISQLPGYLYYLRVDDNGTTYWKVGITNLGVTSRFKPCDLKKITVLYSYRFENGKDARAAETNILKMFKEYRAKGVNVLRVGNTELFTKDVLQMDHLMPRSLYV